MPVDRLLGRIGLRWGLAVGIGLVCVSGLLPMAIVALSPTSVGQRAARAEERNRRADRVDRAGGRRSAP